MFRLERKIITAGLFLVVPLFADPNAKQEEFLYQIGQKGSYCISINGDEKGCISGADDNGKPVNVMDMMKDHKMSFKNLSDAPHDMVFSGRNAESFAPQMPNTKVVSKQFTQADPEKQEIACSFHGFQLGLGYRVLTAAEEAEAGHKSLPNSAESYMTGGMGGLGGMMGGGGGFGNPRASFQSMMNTGLSDVSDFVMKFGPKSEASRLLESRPELQKTYPNEVAQLKGGNSINFNGMNLERTGLNYQGKSKAGESGGRALASMTGGSSAGEGGNASSEGGGANSVGNSQGSASERGKGAGQGSQVYVAGRALNSNEYGFLPGSNQLFILVRPPSSGHGEGGADLASQEKSPVEKAQNGGMMAGQVFGGASTQKEVKPQSTSSSLVSSSSSKSSSSNNSLRMVLLVSAVGLLGASKLISSNKA